MNFRKLSIGQVHDSRVIVSESKYAKSKMLKAAKFRQYKCHQKIKGLSIIQMGPMISENQTPLTFF